MSRISSLEMDPATRPTDDDPGRDLHLGEDVDPDKIPSGKQARSPERRRRRFRTRTILLIAALVSAWSIVLVNPNIGPLVLFALGAFGMTLGVMGAAMGLGWLGFGLFAAGDRIIGWFRRGSTWPDT